MKDCEITELELRDVKFQMFLEMKLAKLLGLQLSVTMVLRYQVGTSKTSIFTNLVNLLTLKNVRQCLADFVYINSFFSFHSFNLECNKEFWQQKKTWTLRAVWCLLRIWPGKVK